MNNRRFKKAIKRITGLPFNRNLFLYLSNKVRHFIYRSTSSTHVAMPSAIMLELSAHCNLACNTCAREHTYGKGMDKGYMDELLARNIIDQSWPYLDSVGLTGMGETLLYKELSDIVDYIKSKNRGIIVSISTNAQVPGFRETIDRLVNKVDTIQVSMDGLDEIYERIRKKANFRILDDHIGYASDLCRNSNTDLMLNMVVTFENYGQMPSLVRYAAQKKIKYVDFSRFNLAAIPEINHSYYDIYTSPEFLDLYREASHIASQHGITIGGMTPGAAGTGFRKCPFPWTHFYITWNGYLVPCCAKPFPKELNFGNVAESSLIYLLNSEDFRNFRKLWYENKTPAFCEGCEFTATG